MGNKELGQIVEDEKVTTSEVMAMLKIIAKSQDDQLRRQEALERRMANAIKDFNHGFPSDDPKAHREYHEKLIRAADATTQMMTELKYTIIKRGVLGAIYVLIILAIMGLFSKDGADTLISGVKWLVGKS